MRNIYLFILILISVELFAQRRDTITLWTEIQGYSYETDSFFKNHPGIGEIVSVSLVQIPDQTCRTFLKFPSIKLELSSFPEGLDKVQCYYREPNSIDQDTWRGQAIPKRFFIYLTLSYISNTCSLGGGFSFNVKDGSYHIRHKEGDLYYIIRSPDLTSTEAIDKVLYTYPPIPKNSAKDSTSIQGSPWIK